MNIEYFNILRKLFLVKEIKQFISSASITKVTNESEKLYQLFRMKEEELKYKKWIFKIPKNQPFQIIIKKPNGFDNIADIDCCIKGIGYRIIESCIKVTFYKFHQNLKLRIELKEEDNNNEPMYHIHINCQKYPHLFFLPFDLMLICESIFLDFLFKETTKLRKMKEWKKIIKSSQYSFLNTYLNNCVGFLNDSKDTFLELISQPLNNSLHELECNDINKD